VGVQEVRCDKVGNGPANYYAFFCGTGNINCHLGTGFFAHVGIRSVVNRGEFVSDRMS
jgi:hypothetical protein